MKDNKKNCFIPYSRQFIDNSDIKSVCNVLKSNFISQGPVCEKFSKDLIKYTGSNYVTLVNSGTSALQHATSTRQDVNDAPRPRLDARGSRSQGRDEAEALQEV